MTKQKVFDVLLAVTFIVVSLVAIDAILKEPIILLWMFLTP